VTGRSDQSSGDTPSFGDAAAVVVVRDGRLPSGADDAVAEAGGTAVVVGSGSESGAHALSGAGPFWWAETGAGFRPALLAALLSPLLEQVPLLVLPASPDGRDLAPRLAATLGRPLVPRAVGSQWGPGPTPGTPHGVHAVVTRLDDRVLLPVEVDGPAVVTLVPGSGATGSTGSPKGASVVRPLPDQDGAAKDAARIGPLDPDMTALLEPDLHTMDLSEATRVLAGGAGLVAGSDDRRATEVFGLLGAVAAALGGSAGATRVATDAGWTGYERQIGTTGVTIDPELYIAFGISGAAQHVGGLGTPRHIVSVNTDASCPMTAMADLGLVTDAQALLIELGHRFGIDLPHPAELPDHRPDGAHDRNTARRQAHHA
jgi:electron transfer flavoprotein alpha subunit